MEFKTRTKTIKVDNKDYKINEPSSIQMARLSSFRDMNPEEMTASELEEKMFLLIDIVNKMGLDREVCEILPAEVLFQIAGCFNTEGK